MLFRGDIVPHEEARNKDISMKPLTLKKRKKSNAFYASSTERKNGTCVGMKKNQLANMQSDSILFRFYVVGAYDSKRRECQTLLFHETREFLCHRYHQLPRMELDLRYQWTEQL